MTAARPSAPDRDHRRVPRPALGVPSLTLLAAAFIIGFDNVAFWHQLASVSRVGTTAGLGFASATAVFLVSALALMMSVFAFRWIYKPFLIGLLIVAAVVGYFMQTYGVVIDDTMIRNTLDTDTGEAEGLFNFTLVWHIVVFGLLPAAFVAWVRIKRAVWWRQALIRVLFGVVLAAIAVGALASHYKEFSLTLRQHRELRMYINPTYAIYSAAELAHGEADVADHPLVTIAPHAHRTAAARRIKRRKIVIVVVGETTRATDWGMDGYHRQTTPELAALPNLINFPNAHSCGTSTAISVPCMFSAKSRADFNADTAGYTENLLDVLKRAGITVRWEENQAGGCKGVCDRVPTQNMRKMRIPGVCGDGHCLDSVFLHGLADRINATSGDLLLVMHTMGSHGPSYFERYPKAFEKYKPICHSNRPQDCSTQTLTNSYDNTVRYVDHVLASLIGVLKTKESDADTALIYMSDHGESLGEDGIYLHGFPYMLAPSQQTHIPMILWLSPDWRHDNQLSNACLSGLKKQRVGQDNLFSTVMGMFDVRADVYQPKLDLLAPCRGQGSVASN
ncbi:phosphoethanolamine transferase [Salinisphaera hydrothermalis]|uniref:Sulfatase n=1 Tax=Salinisphaera hydrothermalis (strain C41B8) TaxID=1304275 RepID=A0A084IIT5_SALHC|nr:phosphoethanolamine--lipid A transferase [Salinisphaera hydrothermalis]KEZ76619.1 Sulfatase [Salinisphaera hydrothermalis C41B8]